MAASISSTLSITQSLTQPTPDRIHVMPRLLTADDLMPLVASLPDGERMKLLRWIASPRCTDASAYRAVPPAPRRVLGR